MKDISLSWPFETPKESEGFSAFCAEGFNNAVYGHVYDGKELACQFPLGALGTGYLGIPGSGKIESVSIYNDLVPPMNWNKDWLFVKTGNLKEGLSASSKQIWGHFPVLDTKAQFHAIPAQVGIRMFSPFVLGDEKISGMPAVAFEIQLKNISKLETIFDLEFQFPPAEKKLTSSALVLSNPSQIFSDSKGSVSFHLAPGESKTVRGVFAWHASLWRDSSNEAHVNQYEKLYPNAEKTAKELLKKFDSILSRILAGQSEIYSDPKLPNWLKDSLVQSLYSLPKNSVWLAKTRKDEWWSEENGWFEHSESHRGCPITETMVCRMHGHFPMLFFYPQLEETALRAFRHFQLEDGEIAFSFGGPTSMRDPRYHCQHPLDAGYYVQQILRYFQRTGDKQAFAKYYESLKKAIRYQYSLDDDNDGLVNDQPHVLPGELWPANQFYDLWPWWGTSVYVAGVWLSTLKAGVQASRIVSDLDFELECRAAFTKGKEAFDTLLWSGDHYKVWANPEAQESCDISLSNQLMAQWCADILGLGSVIDPEKVQLSLDTVARLNGNATAFGLVNGVDLDGKRFSSMRFEMNRSSEITQQPWWDDSQDHSAQIFVGESFAAAQTFLFEGRTEEGLAIAEKIYSMVALNSNTPWDQYCLYDAASGQPTWGKDYYSNMIQWLLPVALEKMSLQDYFADENNLVSRILRASKKKI